MSIFCATFDEGRNEADMRNQIVLRETKVQLGMRPLQKDVIARAAKLKQTTMTNFMVEHAFSAAQQILADQTHFYLSPEFPAGSFQGSFQVAVGTIIADGPPHRSVRAALLHTAPTLDSGVKADARIRV